MADLQPFSRSQTYSTHQVALAGVNFCCFFDQVILRSIFQQLEASLKRALFLTFV